MNIFKRIGAAIIAAAVMSAASAAASAEGGYWTVISNRSDDSGQSYIKLRYLPCRMLIYNPYSVRGGVSFLNIPEGVGGAWNTFKDLDLCEYSLEWTMSYTEPDTVYAYVVRTDNTNEVVEKIPAQAWHYDYDGKSYIDVHLQFDPDDEYYAAFREYSLSAEYMYSFDNTTNKLTYFDGSGEAYPNLTVTFPVDIDWEAEDVDYSAIPAGPSETEDPKNSEDPPDLTTPELPDLPNKPDDPGAPDNGDADDNPDTGAKGAAMTFGFAATAGIAAVFCGKKRES